MYICKSNWLTPWHKCCRNNVEETYSSQLNSPKIQLIKSRAAFSLHILKEKCVACVHKARHRATYIYSRSQNANSTHFGIYVTPAYAFNNEVSVAVVRLYVIYAQYVRAGVNTFLIQAYCLKESRSGPCILCISCCQSLRVLDPSIVINSYAWRNTPLSSTVANATNRVHQLFLGMLMRLWIYKLGVRQGESRCT